MSCHIHGTVWLEVLKVPTTHPPHTPGWPQRRTNRLPGRRRLCQQEAPKPHNKKANKEPKSEDEKTNIGDTKELDKMYQSMKYQAKKKQQ